MSGQSNSRHSIIAVIAAVLMSSVTVGAAVAPAQGISAPFEAAVNA
jgi:hypothetical protein